MSTVIDIPLDQVAPNGTNVRHKITKDSLKELVVSIQAHGVIQPLIAHRGEDGSYTLISGHRRLAAAAQAGLETVPVTVVDLSEGDRIEVALIENLQRVDLSPMEEAEGYFQLVERGTTAKALAKKIGRSEQHIKGRLGLLRLPTSAQKAITEGKIGLEAAKEALTAIDELEKAGLEVPEKEIQDALTSQYNPGNAVANLAKRLLRDAEAEAEATKYPGSVSIGHAYTFDSENRKAKRLSELFSEAKVQKAHAGEPCHHTVVQPSSFAKPDIFVYCTDPKRHGAKGESAIKAVAGDAKPDPAKEDAKLTKLINVAHRSAALDLLGKSLKATIFDDLVVNHLFGAIGYSEVKDVCAWLGIEEAVLNGRGERDWQTTLSTWADSMDKRKRALAAQCLIRTAGAARATLLERLVDYKPIEGEAERYASYSRGRRGAGDDEPSDDDIGRLDPDTIEDLVDADDIELGPESDSDFEWDDED